MKGNGRIKKKEREEGKKGGKNGGLKVSQVKRQTKTRTRGNVRGKKGTKVMGIEKKGIRSDSDRKNDMGWEWKKDWKEWMIEKSKDETPCNKKRRESREIE